MKRLLVLGAGMLQTAVIKKAKKLGYHVIAADGNPMAVGLKYSDECIIANITSPKEMLEIAQKAKIDGVIHPCSEVSMAVMGKINDVLKLSGITEDQAIRATNKHLMRESFERYNAPSPKSILTTSAEEAWRFFLHEFAADAILKPSRNSGSRGISRVTKNTSKEEFQKLYETAHNESRDNSVLLEQFISGPEFSVEIIVWDNQIHVIQVTDKKTTEAPYFVELGHSQPSSYSDDILNKIKTAAVLGVQALEVNNCACHAEIKYENDKAYIIEIGARLGGDFISTELTHLSTGIDMVAAAINCALGIPPNLEPIEESKAACIRYFCPSPGKLTEIKHLDCLLIPEVYSYEIYCKPGDIISEVRSSLNRSGHIIVTGENIEDATKLCDSLINSIEFRTE